MRATTRRGWLPVAVLLSSGAVGGGCEATETHDAQVENAASDEPSVQQAELPWRLLEIPAAASPPLLDGERDMAYQRMPAQNIARLVRGARPSPTDLAATWHALHDVDALYLFVEVADERVVVDSNAATPWEDDAVEVCIDGDVSGGTRYDGVDDVQLIVRPGDSRVGLGTRSAPVRVDAIGYRSRRRAGGYAVELRIPWWVVHTRWHRGKTLGFDVHVDDDDGAGREAKLTWWSRDDEAWQVPERLGRVRLSPKRAPREPASFEGLGDLPGGAGASYVTDLSASGGVVVGHSKGVSGTEAVRWTPHDGLVGLGGAPSRAEAVSPNGQLVVGSGTGPNPLPNAGVIWRGTQPLEYLRGGPQYAPGGPLMFSLREPTVVQDDGVVFGSCVQFGAYGARLGCRQDAPGKITLLPPMSSIYDVDTEGNRAGNRASPPRGEPVGPVANLNGVDLGHPPRSNCLVPHSCRSDAQAFSAGAAVVVGTSLVPEPNDSVNGSAKPLFDAAFVYTKAEGMQRLPDLAGGVAASGAYAISADGRVIAGFGTDDDDQHAVVWIDRRPRKLRDLVRERGSDVPEGWSLLEVRALSADGRTFAGNALNPRGEPEGFRIVLPQAP